ncbi:MAG: ParA family protein [Acidimicrobiales bacterium]
MMWCLWSAKGGSGCSTVSAGLAVLAARRGPTLLVDLAGDQPALLGVADESDPEGRRVGVGDWLLAPHPPPDALGRLERPVNDRLALLPAGEPLGARDPAELEGRWRLLGALLAGDGRDVVIDCGTHWRHARPLLGLSPWSLLVTRACFLGLRRSARGPTPDGVILVREPQRAITAADAAAAVGAAVVAVVPTDPAVARAVDAGLLLRRLPRSFRPLDRLLDLPDLRPEPAGR